MSVSKPVEHEANGQLWRVDSGGVVSGGSTLAAPVNFCQQLLRSALRRLALRRSTLRRSAPAVESEATQVLFIQTPGNEVEVTNRGDLRI